MHSNTLRKVYAALEAQGYATTRHGSGTVAHVRDAAGAAAVRRIADGALASARGEGADAQLVAMAILAGAGRRQRAARPPRPIKAAARRARAAEPRRTAARPAARTFPPVLPPDVMRGSYVGLVTGDAALVARAREEAERRGVRLRVAGPDDDQTLGDLVWGCELVIVGRDARDDETAQRVLRSARDLLEMA